MHTNSSFSAAAGPQALGYFYQAQYALYTLLTADGEELVLILEGLDDAELQSATATELQQLKHHLAGGLVESQHRLLEDASSLGRLVAETAEGPAAHPASPPHNGLRHFVPVSAL